MYVQVCILLGIAYIVGMLGRYLCNPRMDRWKAAKKVMEYLQSLISKFMYYIQLSYFIILNMFSRIFEPKT